MTAGRVSGTLQRYWIFCLATSSVLLHWCQCIVTTPSAPGQWHPRADGPPRWKGWRRIEKLFVLIQLFSSWGWLLQSLARVTQNFLCWSFKGYHQPVFGECLQLTFLHSCTLAARWRVVPFLAVFCALLKYCAYSLLALCPDQVKTWVSDAFMKVHLRDSGWTYCASWMEHQLGM